LAALYRRQGDAAKAKGDLGAAQNDYEQAFALHQRLVAQHPGDPIHRQPLLDSLITLLQLAQQRGDRVAAKRHLQAARAMQADLAQKGLFVSDDVLQLLRGPP
jgi:tetratricopeptide (TPR) repeat protein